MVLSLRRTRLEKQPVFADLQDWQVLEDGNKIGRIYEQHAPASPHQAWFWSITVPLDMRAKVVTSGRAPKRAGEAGFPKELVRLDRLVIALTDSDPDVPD